MMMVKFLPAKTIITLARELRKTINSRETQAETVGAEAAAKTVATVLHNVGVVDQTIFLALAE
jgi:hypothetical protein